VGGTNDCIAYINKLTNMAGPHPTSLFISASQTGYGNTNWYFDDAGDIPGAPFWGFEAVEGVEANGISSNAVTYTPITTNVHITAATNVAGYYTWGADGGLSPSYATNETIEFFDASMWYIMETGESYNGQRIPSFPQGNFLSWYATNAFGG
jgi:hypothetical protein